MTTLLPILHFNDVYRVTEQKLPNGEFIDCTQFATLLHRRRAEWRSIAGSDDNEKDGLVLFSGDAFSPSVESSVTRGSHMVPLLNALSVDVAVTGNHDFDFGFPHLTTLLKDSKFPWLLSNVIDTETDSPPLRESVVLQKCGIRVGVIGLVERDWIETVSSWPPNFQWQDMHKVAMSLSQQLRDPKGTLKIAQCDPSLYLHSMSSLMSSKDIKLAKSLMASIDKSVAASHGVDILLGGHDHMYYVSKGVQDWSGYDKRSQPLGSEEDDGSILLVKSGTDFRDLSELVLEISDAPPGSVRSKIISAVKGQRCTVTPDIEKSKDVGDLLETLLSHVTSALKKRVCRTEAPLDLRSEMIRVTESASGNWFADILRHSFDNALCVSGGGGSDGVFICAGTLRGDSVYNGRLRYASETDQIDFITLGDIMEILPFDDPIVVLELDGKAIWDALESSLQSWPAQEGRFPVISGFRVEWDSRRPPGERVLKVGFIEETGEVPIERSDQGRKYKIVTREYMAAGHDGYDALANHKYLVDEEAGQVMSSIARRYLLGSQYLIKMKGISEHAVSQTTDLSGNAQSLLSKWRDAAHRAVQTHEKHHHYRHPMTVAMTEHMSEIDHCIDGTKVRQAKDTKISEADPVDGSNQLLVIHPVVDGRLRDVAR